MTGKEIRISRLFHNGKMFCVPLDHGITIHEISHLRDFKSTVRAIIENGASSIIVHKGMVKFLPRLNQTGLIVHISASTENINPVQKTIICEVEEAIKLGADAVSIHVNLGNDFEKQMLADFARISSDCCSFGIPLFAMMYIRDNSNLNIDINTKERVEHSIRIATEMGADIVKIGSGLNGEELKEIITNSLIPIVIAGGDIIDKSKLYSTVHEAIQNGASGISFGRNIFMSENPEETTIELAKIIYT